jgi:hypothetical protein
MTVKILVNRIDDGRWIAEVPGDPPGRIVGDSRDDVIAAAQAFALRALADEIAGAPGLASLGITDVHFEISSSRAMPAFLGRPATP